MHRALCDSAARARDRGAQRLPARVDVAQLCFRLVRIVGAQGFDFGEQIFCLGARRRRLFVALLACCVELAERGIESSTEFFPKALVAAAATLAQRGPLRLQFTRIARNRATVAVLLQGRGARDQTPLGRFDFIRMCVEAQCEPIDRRLELLGKRRARAWIDAVERTQRIAELLAQLSERFPIDDLIR